MDFEKALHPQPLPGPPTDISVHYGEGSPLQQYASTIDDAWGSVTTQSGFQGQFAIHFPCMQNPLQCIMSLLQGQIFQLVSLDVPAFIIQVTATWYFPVFGPIMAFIGFTATMDINIRQLSIASSATEVFTTGRIMALVNSISLATQDENNTQLHTFSASLTLFGGIGIFFVIFSGYLNAL